MSDSVSAVLLYRVSTDEQGKSGYSLPEQRRECLAKAHELAAGRHLETYEFQDVASGEILDRPGLDACREFMRRTPTDFFICLDPDRFARNLFLQLLVTQEIEKAGIQLVFVQHRYENTAEGRMFYQLRGSFSEFEKAKIKERTARGRRGKLAAGKMPNRVQPWGYTWDKTDKTLSINPEQGPWVTQVFQWYLEGASYLRIATMLTSMGVPSPGGGTWYRKTIQRILQNSAYVGHLVVNKWDAAGRTPLRTVPKAKRRSLTATLKPESEWVTIEIDPLITEEEWQRVRAMHANRTRLSQPGVGLLSGLCTCAKCGTRMHYAGTAKKRYLRCGGRYPHFRDGGPEVKDAVACSMRNVPAAKIEAQIWAQLIDWLRDPNELEQAREQQRNRVQGDSPEQTPLALLQQELTARQADHRQIYRLIVKRLAPPEAETDLETLSRQIRVLESEIAAAEAKHLRLTAPPKLDLGSIEQLGRQVLQELDRLTLEGRQRVVRSLLEEVVILADEGQDRRWTLTIK